METEYSTKLKNPKWQRRRLEVMQRDDFKCTLCNDDATTLNVHHLKYTGEPWDAKIEDLQTLCEDCHFVIHEILDSKHVKLNEIEAIQKKHCYDIKGKISPSTSVCVRTKNHVLFYIVSSNEARFITGFEKSDINNLFKFING